MKQSKYFTLSHIQKVLIPNFAEIISESLTVFASCCLKNTQVKLLWDCSAAKIIIFLTTIHQYVCRCPRSYMYYNHGCKQILAQIKLIILQSQLTITWVQYIVKSTPQRCSLQISNQMFIHAYIHAYIRT